MYKDISVLLEEFRNLNTQVGECLVRIKTLQGKLQSESKLLEVFKQNLLSKQNEIENYYQKQYERE